MNTMAAHLTIKVGITVNNKNKHFKGVAWSYIDTYA